MYSMHFHELRNKLLLGIVILNILCIDLYILNSFVFKRPIVLPATSKVVQKQVQQTIQQLKANSVCPDACISTINQATSSMKLSTQTFSGNSANEYYIPFGAGSNSSTSWTNVPGIQANVDPTQYSNIKSIYFEASAHIPTQNGTVSIQLFNVTDNNVVPGSLLSLSGGTSQLLVSPSISLPNSNKLYQVQMVNQLPITAILDSARIRITTY